MATGSLDRDEYVEQAYFFRTYRERLKDDVPSQEIIVQVREELLSTTRLPVALEVLTGELVLSGRLSDGMVHLPHYFTAFQTFVMSQTDEDGAKLDQQTALAVLEKEAEYQSGTPTPQGLFIFQFESIARNRLGYDRGLKAVAADPTYDKDFRKWILKIRTELGTIDFADMLYVRSELAVEDRRRRPGQAGWEAPYPILFGLKEGQIARANMGKDPLYMFAALQRHLGYPEVPRSVRPAEPELDPALAHRLQVLEKRVQLLEAEAKGGIDLTEFYVKPEGGDETD